MFQRSFENLGSLSVYHWKLNLHDPCLLGLGFRVYGSNQDRTDPWRRIADESSALSGCRAPGHVSSALFGDTITCNIKQEYIFFLGMVI